MPPSLRRLPGLRVVLEHSSLARRMADLVEEVYARAAGPALRPTAPPPPALDRKAKTLFAIDRRGRGLEIGASYSPMAPRSAGFAVEVVDHATTAELREKYRNDPNVDVSRIEEVDHVWRGEPLDELLGGRRYDWIIASHVVEHIPDLISFFRQCVALLAPGGTLSLVIPDKRYCFDFFRWPSTTGDFLQAFVEGRRRHPAGVVFDHFAQLVTRGSAVTWNAETSDDFRFFYKLDDAKAIFERARDDDQYIDVHCWRFTPASFRLLVTELRLLGLVALEEVCAFPTEGCEFFVTLRPTTAPMGDVDRMRLYREVASELLEGLQEKRPQRSGRTP